MAEHKNTFNIQIVKSQSLLRKLKKKAIKLTDMMLYTMGTPFSNWLL
jgi:hypothetical protein